MVRIAVMLAVLSVFAGRAAAQAPPRIRITTDPGLLQISSAMPGSPPTPVSDAVTTYQIRVNAVSVKKITAQLSAPLPAGVTLTVTLAPPPGGTSLGPVTLDASARDVVINITNVNTTLGITYQLNSTTTAGVIPAASRTVTFNLVDYP